MLLFRKTAIMVREHVERTLMETKQGFERDSRRRVIASSIHNDQDYKEVEVGEGDKGVLKEGILIHEMNDADRVTPILLDVFTHDKNYDTTED